MNKRRMDSGTAGKWRPNTVRGVRKVQSHGTLVAKWKYNTVKGVDKRR